MEIGTKLFFNEKDRGFLGKGRIELLKAIEKYGSINKAAKALGISYKKAWESVSAMNALSPQPLILSQTGGKRGGGSELTPYAKELIERYEEADKTIQKIAKNPVVPKISARNKIYVTVKKIKQKKDEVIVTGSFGKEKIKAIITPEALKELDLHLGEEVWFVFKASAVNAKDENCFKGSLIEKISENRVKVEVEDQIFFLNGKFKIKGFAIYFCIDPHEIMIFKGLV
ncbi:molybdenum-dependent transcriptional regulator [Nitratiruptor tergarcus]|uniref:Molybdate transport system regulatory protein n=1 Tax=Nitratiruptor tergarcus DSM 16512 TaxID=1069081 RepID=A0A1W1WSY4_9BACT|nr:molybdenum-dependent transcriptional regulator [Nitratiruptor tergarcus]SMC08833.1 molybdate transport system regulatory protein [Nitratiruptor tergarcus DSM 16512]